MNSADDNLDAVSKLVHQSGEAELLAWWVNSLTEFNAHAGRKPLCACLGIEPYSGQFPSLHAARAARDEHLRAAYAAMAHPSIRSFQTRLQSFLVRTWPGIQVYTRPPERLTTVERELFFALKTGVRIPGSVAQIAESVRKVG